MKKSLRKALSCILACTIITTVSLPSFAAMAERTSPTSEEWSQYTVTDIDVTVGTKVQGIADPTLTGSTEEIEEDIIDITKKESVPKIYVTVSWDDLEFIYDFGKVVKYTWDIDKVDYVPTYEYDFGNTEPGWNKESVDITFTNYSNRDVYCYTIFEANHETDVYDDVDFETENQEVHLASAVGRGKENLDSQVVTYTIKGAPSKDIDKENPPALGVMKFALLEHSRVEELEEAAAEETKPAGEHEHHYVYDQFGRLVCTGCNDVKHEYCIDEDEDGLCDECGMERDFCPDCHIGGTCKCI